MLLSHLRFECCAHNIQFNVSYVSNKRYTVEKTAGLFMQRDFLCGWEKYLACSFNFYSVIKELCLYLILSEKPVIFDTYAIFSYLFNISLTYLKYIDDAEEKFSHDSNLQECYWLWTRRARAATPAVLTAHWRPVTCPGPALRSINTVI